MDGIRLKEQLPTFNQPLYPVDQLDTDRAVELLKRNVSYFLEHPTATQDDHQTELLARRFRVKEPVGVLLDAYVDRLHKHLSLSPAVCVAACHYVRVVSALVETSSWTIHRLVLGAVRVACKVIEDVVHRHGFVAQVGGVSPRELMRLELGVLFLQRFDVGVTMQRLQAAYDDMLQEP